MARKNTSVLEDLMGISAHLPWKAGIVLAVIAYFVLHYFATKAPLTTNPAELKAMGKTLGDGMAQGIWTMLASVLQYVLPLVFLFGAGLSFKRQHNKGESLQTDTPTCPKCGSTMVKRVAKTGANVGNAFWGCSQYPSCRGIRN